MPTIEDTYKALGFPPYPCAKCGSCDRNKNYSHAYTCNRWLIWVRAAWRRLQDIYRREPNE